jgi:hypothetical protein
MFVPMFVDKDRDEDGGVTRIGTMIETKMGTEICPGGPTSASAVIDENDARPPCKHWVGV